MGRVSWPGCTCSPLPFICSLPTSKHITDFMGLRTMPCLPLLKGCAPTSITSSARCPATARATPGPATLQCAGSAADCTQPSSSHSPAAGRCKGNWRVMYWQEGGCASIEQAAGQVVVQGRVWDWMSGCPRGLGWKVPSPVALQMPALVAASGVRLTPELPAICKLAHTVAMPLVALPFPYIAGRADGWPTGDGAGTLTHGCQVMLSCMLWTGCACPTKQSYMQAPACPCTQQGAWS